MNLAILYVLIGMMVVHTGIQEDENYGDVLRGDIHKFIFEVLNWMPDTIERIIRKN